MAYFKATIEVLVEADNDIEASDIVSETLRPLLREFEPPGGSDFIDWRYTPPDYPRPTWHSGEGFEYAGDAHSPHHPDCPATDGMGCRCNGTEMVE